MNSIKTQSSLSNKPAIGYSIAEGFENIGWLGSGDFHLSQVTSFYTSQSQGMSYLATPPIPVPILGGTTVKYGFQIFTSLGIFALKVMSSVMPLADPEHGYYPLDIAYDYSSDKVYVLYLNYPFMGEGGTVLAQKPNADGPSMGFYLGVYRFNFVAWHASLTPLNDLIPIYTDASSDIRDWDQMLMGLACDNGGQLYTMDYKNGYLYSLNSSTGSLTSIGNMGIHFLDPMVDIDNYVGYELINLEYDVKNDNLYLLDAVHLGGGGPDNALQKNLADAPPPPIHSQLYRVNPSTAAATLLTDGTGYNYLWTSGVGTDYNHFISGLTIPQNGIHIFNPIENEIIYAGESYLLYWIGLRINKSKVQYSTDEGVTWQTIVDQYTAGPITGSGWTTNIYSWTPPRDLPVRILLRISDADNPLVFDQKHMRIFELDLKSPNGGERWLAGSQQTISWYSTMPDFITANVNKKAASGIYPVSLFYTTNNGDDWDVIELNVPAVNGYNSYTWNTPTVTSNECRVCIVTGDAASADTKALGKAKSDGMFDMSEECFTLYTSSPSGNLVINSPNGGENLSGGKYQYITWTRAGIVPGAFLLEYSSDGGRTWNKINNSPIAGVMRYNWLVPQIQSTHCLVRISNYLSHREYDRSNSEFTINTTAVTEAKNFPNPFNPTTKIVFGLEKSSFTSLKVYNSIGQQVAELVNKQLEAGMHEYEFNASNLPSGVYFYNLKKDDKTEIHKMLLLK